MPLTLDNADDEEDKKGERRIVDLRVDEVSDVDRPAIQRVFLIVKRLENEHMGAFDTDGKDVEITKAEFDEALEEITKALEGCGFEFSEIDVEKALPPDLTAALKATIPWMRRMAGQAEGDTRKAILRVVAFLTKVSGGRYPYPAPKGASAKAAKPEEEEEMKGGKKQEEEDKYPSPKPKSKSKALTLDEDDAQDLILKSVSEALVKGRRFTPKRTAAIADSVKGMLSLLKETDEEAFKKLIGELGGDTQKAAKQDEEEEEEEEEEKGKKGKEKDDVKKQLADLSERFEKLEKARAPSQSVDGDGGTDGKPVEKKQGLWSDIL